MALSNRSFLDPRLTSGAHTLQLVLAIIIVVITIARMTRPIPFTRGQIMALTMVRLSSFSYKLCSATVKRTLR